MTIALWEELTTGTVVWSWRSFNSRARYMFGKNAQILFANVEQVTTWRIGVNEKSWKENANSKVGIRHQRFQRRRLVFRKLPDSSSTEKRSSCLQVGQPWKKFRFSEVVRCQLSLDLFLEYWNIETGERISNLKLEVSCWAQHLKIFRIAETRIKDWCCVFIAHLLPSKPEVLTLLHFG